MLDRVKSKIRALLRLKDFYPLPVMLDQYKNHIWDITEYSDVGLYKNYILSGTQTGQIAEMIHLRVGYLGPGCICDV